METPGPFAVSQADIDATLRYEEPIILPNLQLYHLYQGDMDVEDRVRAIEKMFGRASTGTSLPDGAYRWTDYRPDVGIVIRKYDADRKNKREITVWKICFQMR